MYVVFSKYILVGIANTLCTLCIIFVLMYSGTNLYYANFFGYAGGIILSFLLNASFTFSIQISIRKFFKFLVSCLVCYGINLIAIRVFLIFFPEMNYLAQLWGMGFYVISGFLMNMLWVMK